MSDTDGMSDPTYEPSEQMSPLPSPAPYPSGEGQRSWQQGSWGNQGPYFPPGMPASKICPACGVPLMATSVVCPRCGTAVSSPRSKGVAVLIAVFLGFWTWLYTYQQDKAKFWWGLVLTIVGFVLSFFLIGFAVLFGVWLWSVIATATKPEEAYRAYPNGV